MEATQREVSYVQAIELLTEYATFAIPAICPEHSGQTDDGGWELRNDSGELIAIVKRDGDDLVLNP